MAATSQRQKPASQERKPQLLPKWRNTQSSRVSQSRFWQLAGVVLALPAVGAGADRPAALEPELPAAPRPSRLSLVNALPAVAPLPARAGRKFDPSSAPGFLLPAAE
jgi:hypothetical protein